VVLKGCSWKLLTCGTANTHLTKVHTCNKGTQQPTKWLLVAFKASVAGAHHQLASKLAQTKAGQWITAHKEADSAWCSGKKPDKGFIWLLVSTCVFLLCKAV
jgi:hypothetical protein